MEEEVILSRVSLCPCSERKGLEKENAELLESCRDKDRQLNNWFLSYNEVIKENAELNRDKTELVNSVTELENKVTELKAQIEKMKSFIHSEIDFCMYCPLTETCKNDEGTCPYANTSEEEQKEILAEWITKIGS